MPKIENPPAFPMPLDIQRFLMGNGPLEGVWFGDEHPTREGAFWWRSVIRERADEGYRNTREPDVIGLLREARPFINKVSLSPTVLRQLHDLLTRIDAALGGNHEAE